MSCVGGKGKRGDAGGVSQSQILEEKTIVTGDEEAGV